jgi:hypothetical protein
MSIRYLTTHQSLPDSLASYDSELMNQLISQEYSRVKEKRIPESQLEFFIGSAAVQEVNALIKQARLDYLTYVLKKSGAKKYIEEINSTILPDDGTRLRYLFEATDSAKPSNTHLYEYADRGNYAPLQMDIYPSTIYQYAMQFQQAQLLGNQPFTIYRDMAIRYIVFHEMTHVLQQAVDVVNAPLMDKTALMPWASSNRRILNIDTRYYPDWGSTIDLLTRNINNVTVAKESQAEGVSLVVLGDMYHLSSKQCQSLWDHHVTSLQEGKQALDEAFLMLNTYDPSLNMESVVHELRKKLQVKQSLSEPSSYAMAMRFVSRLEGFISAHQGYLHPMSSNEVKLFFEYIRK